MEQHHKVPEPTPRSAPTCRQRRAWSALSNARHRGHICPEGGCLPWGGHGCQGHSISQLAGWAPGTCPNLTSAGEGRADDRCGFGRTRLSPRTGVSQAIQPHRLLSLWFPVSPCGCVHNPVPAPRKRRQAIVLVTLRTQCPACRPGPRETGLFSRPLLPPQKQGCF